MDYIKTRTVCLNIPENKQTAMKNGETRPFKTMHIMKYVIQNNIIERFSVTNILIKNTK